MKSTANTLREVILKYITGFLLTFFLISSAFSSDTEWQPVKKSNTSKISSYLNNKSCVSARKTLLKNDWTPFPAFEGKAMNRNMPMFKEAKDIFRKYPELEHCYSTGTGSCFAGYKKGKFLLTVEYGSAEGGYDFEEKHCQASSYKISLKD